MDFKKASVALHKKCRGKLEVGSKVSLKTKKDLSLAYTPGVAGVCEAIAKDKSKVYELTPKGNMVGIVSDGSAVLGLGNIGAEAAIPVMEGKAVALKQYAGIDGFPICLATQNKEEIISVVKSIAPVFGAINLEDIKAPHCFEIEKALQGIGIPVMHDDQHGTAVVLLAGLLNALKVVGKKLSEVQIVVNGAGAAGVAITKLLLSQGVHRRNIVLCDHKGSLYVGRKDLEKKEWAYKKEISKVTNSGRKKGKLNDILKGADVFIGVSVCCLLDEISIKEMAKDPVVFALANPKPEVDPKVAKRAGAKVVATGRSDIPNQVNNVLAFPGIFRGALDVRATRITEEMKLGAARALAGLVKKPHKNKILPLPSDKRVVKTVAKAVMLAWKKGRGEKK